MASGALDPPPLTTTRHEYVAVAKGSTCKSYINFCVRFAVSKFIRIGIADKNDNPPYFDKALYEAEVDENEDIQHTVLTVTAKDHDEC